MATKRKVLSFTCLLFVLMILSLAFIASGNIELIDIAYLIFIFGCFIRFIYIKTH